MIVQPDTRVRCRADEVGEIWVAGDIVTQGYWNRPVETEETFNALIAATDDGPFFRTGDLGFLHDGQLYVTGRCKDLIIIRGRNHYPHDIEHTACGSHPALRPDAAAFSVEADGEERLVMVLEIDRSWLRKFEVAEAAAAICSAVAAEHEIALHTLCFVKPGRLPMTSSGKVQRRPAKAAWLSGALEPVASWTSPVVEPQPLNDGSPAETTDDRPALAGAGAIERWLRQELASRFKVDPGTIDIRAPLALYGLDSVTAVELTARLRSRLRVGLSPTMFYDYPTIESMAAFLAGQQHELSGGRGRAPDDELKRRAGCRDRHWVSVPVRRVAGSVLAGAGDGRGRGQALSPRPSGRSPVRRGRAGATAGASVVGGISVYR